VALAGGGTAVLDRSFLHDEQPIDFGDLRTEVGARLLSAGRGVEERAVLGTDRLHANVRFVTTSYCLTHVSDSFAPLLRIFLRAGGAKVLEGSDVHHARAAHAVDGAAHAVAGTDF